MTHFEETRGLLSASDVYACSECHGKRALVAHLREEGMLREVQSIEATLGQRIHASLEGEPEELERKAQEVKDSCERLDRIAVRQYFGGEPVIETLFEHRLWYRVFNTPVFTGRPDRLHRSATRVLDPNFKTGRGDEEESHKNLQLRCEVVLIDHNYPDLDEIGVAIIQPLVTQKPEIAVYDRDAMRAAKIEILEIVDATNWDEERRAGKWCKFCPARAFCPEAHQLAIERPLHHVRFEGDSTIYVNALPSGADASAFMDRLSVAYDILNALWDAFTAKVIEDPESVPGWQISKGRATRKWSNPKKAITLVKKLVPLDKVASLPFGKVEDEVAKVWGLKGKALKDKFEEYFGAVVVTEQGKGWLERTPPQLKEKS